MAITRDALKTLCEAPRGAVVAAGAILNMSEKSYLTGSFAYGVIDKSDVDLVLQEGELIIPSPEGDEDEKYRKRTRRLRKPYGA